jgi:DeoR family glycerol-3-phosphate regulon repressor
MTLKIVPPDLSDRQRDIVERVRTTGFVTIEALAVHYDVSAQTVRRDIILLAERGYLQRFHGGAGPVADYSAARLDYGVKRDMGRAEKRKIGRQAAAAIPDGASLFLDVGTTIETCAEELARRPGFRIFTNSIRTAMAFDPSEHSVHVLGGRLGGRDGSLVGEEVVLRLAGLTLDFALIACSAIDDRGRVMDFDLSKIEIKKAAMGVSLQSCLLATRSKYGRTALASVAPLTSFDHVFSD